MTHSNKCQEENSVVAVGGVGTGCQGMLSPERQDGPATPRPGGVLRAGRGAGAKALWYKRRWLKGVTEFDSQREAEHEGSEENLGTPGGSLQPDPEDGVSRWNSYKTTGYSGFFWLPMCLPRPVSPPNTGTESTPRIAPRYLLISVPGPAESGMKRQ